jgi:hypothetical protein
MSEFADLNHVPGELSPSLAQWNQIVGSCAGCLANSEFSNVIHRYNTVIDPGRRESSKFAILKTSGRALHALEIISLGRMESITLAGGHGCGWLAAVAEWLLGLSVTVEYEDGSVPVLYGT